MPPRVTRSCSRVHSKSDRTRSPPATTAIRRNMSAASSARGPQHQRRSVMGSSSDRRRQRAAGMGIGPGGGRRGGGSRRRSTSPVRVASLSLPVARDIAAKEAAARGVLELEASESLADAYARICTYLLDQHLASLAVACDRAADTSREYIGHEEASAWAALIEYDRKEMHYLRTIVPLERVRAMIAQAFADEAAGRRHVAYLEHKTLLDVCLAMDEAAPACDEGTRGNQKWRPCVPRIAVHDAAAISHNPRHQALLGRAAAFQRMTTGSVGKVRVGPGCPFERRAECPFHDHDWIDRDTLQHEHWERRLSRLHPRRLLRSGPTGGGDGGRSGAAGVGVGGGVGVGDDGGAEASMAARFSYQSIADRREEITRGVNTVLYKPIRGGPEPPDPRCSGPTLNPQTSASPAARTDETDPWTVRPQSAQSWSGYMEARSGPTHTSPSSAATGCVPPSKPKLMKGSTPSTVGGAHWRLHPTLAMAFAANISLDPDVDPSL